MVPFDNDESRAQTLMEHLKRSFDHPLDNAGPHGLPLIGRADWNDCLNLNCFSSTPGESFQTTENQAGGVAESVFIAGMFCAIGPDYAALARRRGDEAEADARREGGRGHDGAVVEHTAGTASGSCAPTTSSATRSARNENDEGQIWIEPQGFCVMGGIGVDDGKAIKALDSARERLNTPHGIVLQQPGVHRVPHRVWARSPRTPRATRRTPASSATTTRGSSSPRPSSAAPSTRGSTTSRSPRRTARRSPRSTASSPTSTRR